MIKIFKSTETNFAHDGVGILDDICISSETSWAENSKWVIDAKFIRDNIKSDVIENDMILQVPTEKGLQLFRIIKVNKKNGKYITVNGQHIAFDFDNNFIEDINIVDKTGTLAIKQIQGGTTLNNKFNLSSNIETIASARMVRKNGIQAILGSEENTFVNRWGGFLVLDNYNIAMNKEVGTDKGVELYVGKNVVEFESDVDISNVCTGIKPIAFDGITLPDDEIIYSPLVNNYAEPHIQEFKFEDIKYKYSANNTSEDAEGFETLEEVYEAIRKACNDLYEKQNIDKPLCSIRVKAIELAKTDQFKGDEINERIYQGDVVSVRLSEYGIDVKLKMTANKYDNLRDRYIDFDLGDIKTNIFATISKTQNSVDKIIEQLGGNSWNDILDKSMKEAAQLIEAGISNSYVVARKNEILVMDNQEVESAINVIRINKNGIAFSRTGYNGEFTSAWTIDGKFNASFITTGELNSALIKAGVITSKTGNVTFSLDDDYIEVDHKGANAKTRIDGDCFSVIDKTTNEPIAWLGSKEQWSELYVDKVISPTVMEVYVGPSAIYVNHAYTGNSDGSSDKPFNCFSNVNISLRNKCINKDITIYVVTTGEINDRLDLNGIIGIGSIKVELGKSLIIRGRKTKESSCVSFNNISVPLTVVGGRSSDSSSDGALICDDYYGINFNNCNYFRCENLSIECEQGIGSFYSRGYTKQIDFMNSYCGIYASNSSLIYDRDSVGNCTWAFASLSGSYIMYGLSETPEGDFYTCWKPQGVDKRFSGYISSFGGFKSHESFRATKVAPSIQKYSEGFLAEFSATYYSNGKWKRDECKNGRWLDYTKSGHFFFNLTTIRNFIGTGTVKDSCTICLYRLGDCSENKETDVFCSWSSSSVNSGTPRYEYTYKLGSIKKGILYYFDLKKEIVNKLKTSGGSISFWAGDNLPEKTYYTGIEYCSINIKVDR